MLKMANNKLFNNFKLLKNIFKINTHCYIKIPTRFFCEKIEEVKLLSDKILGKDLKLSKMNINILKYLERNFELYTKLCEDSIKLSFDLSENPEGNDFMKSELLRINRQISTFSKDNFYYDEVRKLFTQIEENYDLIKEAEEIGDIDIKNSAINEIESHRLKLEELQTEIIEYFIPDEYVIIFLN
jgi:hypothetical protein